MMPRVISGMLTLALVSLAASSPVSSVAAGSDAGSLVEEPLADLPAPGARTLFVELTPETTGVRTENRYADPRMWTDLYQEFLFGAIGTGVAIGDYDGDGRPDIFAVSKTEGCRLFRNLGGYRFEDVTERAGVGATPGIWNQGATFVDVNNDGRLDIYVCRFNAPNLLYLNQGGGRFKESAHAYGLDVKDASGMAYFCDYDRDGWLDVYIATNLLDNAHHPDGQRGHVLHNNRNGTFTDVTDAAGITRETCSHSATWWDYDNDGWPDLYVANDYGKPDRLYHNNRDGTFTDLIDRFVPHTSYSSMGSDQGDVRNNGYLDLLVADMAFTTHQMDQRGPADERGKSAEVPDGSGTTAKYHRNALLLNTGTSRAQEAAYLAGVAATDWTWSVRLEDLDNDGRTDLFVTNGMNKEENLDINARMMKAETVAERIQIMRASPHLPESHFAFRNVADLQFEDVSAAWGLNQKGIGFGAALGDLSGNGNLDIVYTNYQQGVTLLRNADRAGHRVDIYLRGTRSNRFGVGATVRVESALGVQVRQLWLGRGYMSSSEPMVHFGFGADTAIRKMTVTWPSGSVQTFENLPVDRRFTVTEPSGAPAAIAPEPPAERAQFDEVAAATGLALTAREEVIDEIYQQRLLPERLNRRGPALAVGDIDGSGRDSVILGGTTLDALRIMTPIGRNSFTTTATLNDTAGANDGPILLFDATGGGRADLLVTKGGNALPAEDPGYQPRLYLNDGAGHFHAAPAGVLPDLPIDAGAVAAADFEHTGRLGVFIGGRIVPGQYPSAPTSALLAARGTRFEDVTDSIAPGLRNVGMVTSALWTDVDADGWPDLLVTLEWGGVRYFHNRSGRAFEDWSERAGFSAAGTGWWTSIAAADFNGDGKIDYVVGNAGLNTPYLADSTHPALLFVGDFRGNGSTELIEAYYEGDRLYPWRTRRDLAAVIPSIVKRFPRNDSFAAATLEEVVGKDKLARARRFAATELRSGVFLSQPDGRYRFEPLPRVAQIAPLQGLVTGYFDGTGHAGIYTVQNSYAPIGYVGRFDGGLSQLLHGDGRGHFDAVPPAISGLVVPGNAKALSVIDLDGDGWPDFLVTRNTEPMLAFRNRGLPGCGSVQVELRGPAGNPNAVGARVAATFADGSTHVAESYAGAGYYSQSAGGVFFSFPKANAPVSFRVHWPAGQVTETKYAGQPTLVMDAP